MNTIKNAEVIGNIAGKQLQIFLEDKPEVKKILNIMLGTMFVIGFGIGIVLGRYVI